MVARMQEYGYSREQVTAWLDLTDAVVTVAQRGTSLVKLLFPLRAEQSR
ncbi:MAG: hypothetical protein ACOY93_13665 [Bacillota bacterium]